MKTIPLIETVKPIEQGRLLIRFKNGERRTYDCKPLLSRPQFRLLSDLAFFRSVRVDVGGYGVSWNDEIDLSEYELWTNGTPIANNSISEYLIIP